MNDKGLIKFHITNHFADKYHKGHYYISTQANYDEKTVLDACKELEEEGLLLRPVYLYNKAWDIIKLKG